MNPMKPNVCPTRRLRRTTKSSAAGVPKSKLMGLFRYLIVSPKYSVLEIRGWLNDHGMTLPSMNQASSVPCSSSPKPHSRHWQAGQVEKGLGRYSPHANPDQVARRSLGRLRTTCSDLPHGPGARPKIGETQDAHEQLWLPFPSRGFSVRCALSNRKTDHLLRDIACRTCSMSNEANATWRGVRRHRWC
jgi:hypothetical protein